MFQCVTSPPPKRTPVDDLYDRVQLQRKAYAELVAECEAAVKDAWAISIRANLMGNKNILLKEPFMAEIMNKPVKVQISTNPTFLRTPQQRHDFLRACIEELLADIWVDKWEGKGSAELAPYGFVFVKSPMIVTVDGYIFELSLRIDENGSCYKPETLVDHNITGDSRESTRNKLYLLWKVIKIQLGVGNSKYDCAGVVMGDDIRFTERMTVPVGGGYRSTLELLKLRTPA